MVAQIDTDEWKVFQLTKTGTGIEIDDQTENRVFVKRSGWMLELEYMRSEEVRFKNVGALSMEGVRGTVPAGFNACLTKVLLSDPN